MQEYSAPGEISLESGDHLLQPLFEHARRTPHKALLAYRQGDRFIDVSAADAADRVRRLARGLIGLGVGKGDRVALMSATRLEWTYLDYAILAAGAVTVPIYDTSSTEQVEWILSDSGAVAAFFENDDLKAHHDAVADQAPDCKHVFTIDGGGLAELEASGAGVTDEQLDERLAGLGITDTATIIYTSGTTGLPKGCVLTHGNLRSNSKNAVAAMPELLTPEDSLLLFLPLAHSFAKILQVASMERGIRVGFATSTQHLLEELPMFQPTFVVAVPRIFEKVFTGAQQKAIAGGKGAIFERAVDTAVAYSKAQESGSPGLGLKLRHALFDKLVYSKLRALFGGRLKSANSGGGPLGARLTHFFNGVGIKIYEGYGLTETSPILTANTPSAWRIGSVGKPIPGTSIRIADDGEILARGPQVFTGYYGNDVATAETIDAENWFHTGDIGELDRDGFVTITGRKKELIVTAGGKNVAPAILEDRLRSHALVSQVIVVGDNRPYVAALVTIDEEQFPAWAERNDRAGRKVGDMIEDPVLRAEIQTAVDHANSAVSKAESIRRFSILPQDFTIEGGEMTPTLKLKRNVVTDRYQEAVEALYR